MFRRSKPESETTSVPLVDDPARPAGKGHPTPTRKEAEAAARARAKGGVDPRAGKREQRAARAAQSRAARQGIRDGDQRYLPQRDRGPVRAFVRDFIDARLNMAEFALPILFASLVFSSSGHPEVGSYILNALLLVIIGDCLYLRWKMRREIRRRFPDESLKGTTFYAYMRALQLRFLRLPKPRVKLGQGLPERY